MNVSIEPSWKTVLQDEFEKPYFCELTQFVREEYILGTVFPPPKQLFAAFEHAPFKDVRVVILGQDPYHNPGQAHGLCFSVAKKVKVPPSLKNIYKEIQTDIGKDIPISGNLTNWANQGVFLLNAILTVRAHEAASHQGKGWEKFTDAVIQKISDNKENVVFLLWGSFAKKKGAHIDRSKHFVLEAAHPSPLSAHNGFFGCKHFSKTNKYLKEHGFKEIDW